MSAKSLGFSQYNIGNRSPLRYLKEKTPSRQVRTSPSPLRKRGNNLSTPTKRLGLRVSNWAANRLALVRSGGPAQCMQREQDDARDKCDDVRKSNNPEAEIPQHAEAILLKRLKP
jgi:hypothetical protein